MSWCICVIQELNHVRGLSSLVERVCAKGVQKVTVVNQTARIIWHNKYECWVHRGQEYLTLEDLRTVFPNAAITPYDRRRAYRYRGKDIKTQPIIIFTNVKLGNKSG